MGVCVPAKIGAVNRGHRASQLCRNEGNVREADLVRESCTVAQNLAQRSDVSRWEKPGKGVGGVRDRMRTNSVLEYDGKRRFADDGERRKPAGGEVTMKTQVRQGI